MLKLHEVPGKLNIEGRTVGQVGGPTTHNVLDMDNDYQMINSHIDESIKVKIQNYEYIDFGKLINRMKMLRDERTKD